MKGYYFDNIAATKVDKEVIKAMLPYFDTYYAMPSSQFSHQPGIFITDKIEQARKNIAHFINADKDEIIFTSGETESSNLAIKGVARANKKRGNHIITVKNEHRSVLNSFKTLEKEGFDVTYLDVDGEGSVDLQQIKDSIRDNTILLSVALVDQVVGTIQPIAEIGKLIKEKQVIFHTNATYGLGYLPLDVEKMGVDLLTISGDKAHAPKGIGVLYKRKDININRIFDGNFNEFYIRPGIENVPGIIGFSKAVDLLKHNENTIEKINELRNILIDKLLTIGDSVLNGSRTKRVANNVNITFYKVEGESVMLHLDMNGISVTTGSACFSRSLEPDYVLSSMGFDHERIHGSIRYSLSKYNTKEEVEYVSEKTKKIIKRLREISPL